MLICKQYGRLLNSNQLFESDCIEKYFNININMNCTPRPMNRRVLYLLMYIKWDTLQKPCHFVQLSIGHRNVGLRHYVILKGLNRTKKTELQHKSFGDMMEPHIFPLYSEVNVVPIYTILLNGNMVQEVGPATYVSVFVNPAKQYA